MKIIVGKNTGFCSGVRKAISGTQEVLKHNKHIFCLGEIIHNPFVVASLKRKGMIFVDDISDVPEGATFIIRSHGLPSDIINSALERRLHIHDFTCPKVKKIHRLAIELTDKGYAIIIIGNPSHPEVKAILSLTRGNARVVEKTEDLDSFPPGQQCAVVVQTTFNPLSFSDIVREVVLRAKNTVVYNTLCEETVKRQREALTLAEEVDFIVVVGGKNSSNTKTLCTIVENRVPVVHVEGAGEVEKKMFNGVRKVGIISGASTPEEEVQKVRSTIFGFFGHTS
jgi:(E)-4-hydroxy-3-methyl-but-2-enyl pyrophosphate reductase